METLSSGVDTPTVQIPVLQHGKETNTWLVKLQLQYKLFFLQL